MELQEAVNLGIPILVIAKAGSKISKSKALWYFSQSVPVNFIVSIGLETKNPSPETIFTNFL